MTGSDLQNLLTVLYLLLEVDTWHNIRRVLGKKNVSPPVFTDRTENQNWLEQWL